MHISRAHISKSKKCFNVKCSAYYFHIKTKIFTDFQICISVPLICSGFMCFCSYIIKNQKLIIGFKLHKNWSFLLRIYSVNANKIVILTKCVIVNLTITFCEKSHRLNVALTNPSSHKRHNDVTGTITARMSPLK